MRRGSLTSRLLHRRAPSRATIPSWLISLVVHALLVGAVAFTTRPIRKPTMDIEGLTINSLGTDFALEGQFDAPPPLGTPLGNGVGPLPEKDPEKVPPGEGPKEGQPQQPDQPMPADEPPPEEPATPQPPAEGGPETSTAEVAAEPVLTPGNGPPVALNLPSAVAETPSRLSPGRSIPRSTLPIVGRGVLKVGQNTGPRGVRTGVVGGLGGTARFFGVEARGTRFVYVVDASGSMSEHGAFSVAKSELLASLQQLDSNQTFQIIFYNDDAVPWKREGSQQPVYFATDINKNLVTQFVRTFANRGGTRHLLALEAALRLDPEVIFFLTDAREPELSAAELDKIQRRCASKVTIHTIEFGIGEAINDSNFLKKLANLTGGRAEYRDVQKFD